MREQRIHKRIPMCMTIYCRNYINHFGEDQPFSDPIKFDVVNLSVGGMLVKSNAFIENEKVLQFTFYLEEIPYVIMSRIRWVEKIAGGYLYGLEFLVTPNMLYRHLHDFVNKQVYYT